MDNFKTTKEALNYLKSMEDDEVRFYANLAFVLSQRPTTNLEQETMRRKLEEARGEMEELKREHDQEIWVFRGKLNEAEGDLEVERRANQKINDLVRPLEASSVAKGDFGEQQVEELLNGMDVKVERTAKRGNAGDFHVCFRGSKIWSMVEVKNLAEGRMVPAGERRRFRSDLDGLENAEAGVLVSLHGPADADVDNLRPSLTPEGKPCMYLGNLSQPANRPELEAALKCLLYLAEERRQASFAEDGGTVLMQHIDQQLAEYGTAKNALEAMRKAVEKGSGEIKKILSDLTASAEPVRDLILGRSEGSSSSPAKRRRRKGDPAGGDPGSSPAKKDITEYFYAGDRK